MPTERNCSGKRQGDLDPYALPSRQNHSVPHIGKSWALAKERNALIVMKFHPAYPSEWVDEYREWAANKKDVLFIDKGRERNQISADGRYAHQRLPLPSMSS